MNAGIVLSPAYDHLNLALVQLFCNPLCSLTLHIIPSAAVASAVWCC